MLSAFLDHLEVDRHNNARTRSVSSCCPDPSRSEGRRDRTLMLVVMQIGLRVSELTGLECGEVALGTGAHLRCEGKGHKLQVVPLPSDTEASSNTG